MLYKTRGLYIAPAASLSKPELPISRGGVGTKDDVAERNTVSEGEIDTVADSFVGEDFCTVIEMADDASEVAEQGLSKSLYVYIEFLESKATYDLICSKDDCNSVADIGAFTLN
jgi:hypothetical protein